MASEKFSVRVDCALYHKYRKSKVASRHLFERVVEMAQKDLEFSSGLPSDDSYGCSMSKSISAVMSTTTVELLEKLAEIYQVSTPSLVRRYLHNRFKELTHARSEETRLPTEETSNI